MRTRVTKFLRELFSSTPPSHPYDEPGVDDGGVGVREPRRPHRPRLGGAVALEVPPEEKRDVRAIGEDRD